MKRQPARRATLAWVALSFLTSLMLVSAAVLPADTAARGGHKKTPTATPTATLPPPTPTPSPTATDTSPPANGQVLIYALYYDPYLSGEPDEAFELINMGNQAVNLSGWQVTDGEGTVTFPSFSLAPDARIWATKTATAFYTEFGFKADFEYGGDSDTTVPDMTGSPPTFANAGDEISLINPSGGVADSLVYEAGDTSTQGWSGPALNPYTQGYFGSEGQILYRKLDQDTGLPVTDTNTADDWAQATDDNINGKKIEYPGWDLERYFMPTHVNDGTFLKYFIAPDNIYDNYVAAINQATTSIDIEGYTINNAHISDALVAREQAGVQVKLLLEEEVVNGISDQEKWICQQLEANGGQCWFMYNDAANNVHDRYNFQHAKFTIIDGSLLLTGSENLDGTSMPADDKSDGTSGNRGVYIETDSPGLISHAVDVFQHDLDPAHHTDVRRWDPASDSPAAGFTPDYTTGGTGYTVQFPNPLSLSGSFDYEVVQSPETSLRDHGGLLGMVARAGAGGTVFVEQLYEKTYWGPTTSNPATDPNPRLEAYISAARRGAKVRILLDSYYDSPTDVRNNATTCSYVNDTASSEGLDLACLTGNPTGTGIHNKMILVWDGSQGWTHTGSLNGSENSSKDNRELAIQVRSTAGYNYLAQMFDGDWVASGGNPILPTPTATPTDIPPTATPTFTSTPTSTFTPTVTTVPATATPSATSTSAPPTATFTSTPTSAPPTPTFTPSPTSPPPTPTFTATPSGPNHLLITEVFYDTPGTDSQQEWMEIYNPTSSAVDLSGYKIGDEETQGGSEGMYQFPAGASLATGQKAVVALKATGFYALYGFNPDYEVVDTDASVPDLTPYSAWASGTIALSNSGDEVLLLNGADFAVDVVTYENGSYPGVIPNPGVQTGHSIERQPANVDTNDCSADFIDQASPSPGQ